MNREEAMLTNYGATISEVISEIKAKIPRIKRFLEMADKENIERWEEKLKRHEEAIGALRGPQPDPITGMVPCGCGGKAYFEKTSDDLYPSKVTCSNCHMSTDYTSDDDRSKRDWNLAMGYKGDA